MAKKGYNAPVMTMRKPAVSLFGQPVVDLFGSNPKPGQSSTTVTRTRVPASQRYAQPTGQANLGIHAKPAVSIVPAGNQYFDYLRNNPNYTSGESATPTPGASQADIDNVASTMKTLQYDAAIKEGFSPSQARSIANKVAGVQSPLAPSTTRVGPNRGGDSSYGTTQGLVNAQIKVARFAGGGDAKKGIPGMETVWDPDWPVVDPATGLVSGYGKWVRRYVGDPTTEGLKRKQPVHPGYSQPDPNWAKP